MEATITKLDRVVKTYNKHHVLNEINMLINEDELLGLVGPSGSGKTTTVKYLLDMEKIDSGSAEILAHKMPNRKALSRLGHMGQTDALYEDLTTHENLEFYGRLSGLRGNILEGSVKRHIVLVNLKQTLDKKATQFSRSMKRQLSLAVTLLAEPELIILDEPTVGIDPKLRRQIWQQFKQMIKNRESVVITTHVMDEAERCDKVGLVVNGRIFAIDTPANLEQRSNVDIVEAVFIKAEEACQS